MPRIQQGDRVVVQRGYAQGAVGVVRHIYEFNDETRFSVDYDEWVHHDNNVYVGGDYTETSLELVDRAADDRFLMGINAHGSTSTS